MVVDPSSSIASPSLLGHRPWPRAAPCTRSSCRCRTWSTPAPQAAARGLPPSFRRTPPWASAAAGQRSISRMMRAPAGFPSLRSSVRLEREVDDEAGGRHRGVSCSAITTRPWRWQLSVLVTRRHGHQVDLLQFQFSMRTVLASFPDFPFSYAPRTSAIMQCM